VRRLAILQITPELLLELFKPGTRTWEVTKNALPLDARVAGVGVKRASSFWYDPDTHAIAIVIESESFAEQLPGTVLPNVDPPECTRREL
jgi:hypothetical protein